MIFLKGLLSGAWAYLAAGAAILVAVLAALASAKRAGKNEVIVEQAKKEAEDVKKAGKVERDVATTRPDAVRKRLKKYQRD